MSEPALCQCVRCHKYLTHNRDPNSESRHKHECRECLPEGLPLAEVREALSDPLSVELLGLATEECGKVSQRIGKIFRWGWDADFEGTTQQHKLEVELGDVLAVMLLMIHNGLVTKSGIGTACVQKIKKFQEDADGPRQRLQVAKVFDNALVVLAVPSPSETPAEAIQTGLLQALAQFCVHCGEMRHICKCEFVEKT